MSMRNNCTCEPEVTRTQHPVGSRSVVRQAAGRREAAWLVLVMHRFLGLIVYLCITPFTFSLSLLTYLFIYLSVSQSFCLYSYSSVYLSAQLGRQIERFILQPRRFSYSYRLKLVQSDYRQICGDMGYTSLLQRIARQMQFPLATAHFLKVIVFIILQCEVTHMLPWAYAVAFLICIVARQLLYVFGNYMHWGRCPSSRQISVSVIPYYLRPLHVEIHSFTHLTGCCSTYTSLLLNEDSASIFDDPQNYINTNVNINARSAK